MILLIDQQMDTYPPTSKCKSRGRRSASPRSSWHAHSERCTSGSPTVSKRELSIPHNAHDAMQKGLTLLYGRLTIKGSVKQFERATHEYPD